MTTALDRELGTLTRIFSATIGACATSLFVQPLDVIKTRLQISTTDTIRPKNSIDAVLTLIRNEGIGHLYAGLRVTLWMNIPMNAVYYSIYDILKHNFLENCNEIQSQLSLKNKILIYGMSGCIGRVFAATLISPLELFRTQQMANTLNVKFSINQAIQKNTNKQNIFKLTSILSLWKGLIPTLWRDVPFSIVYWISYELMKDYLYQIKLQKHIISNKNNNNIIISSQIFNPNSDLGISFFSGVISGTIATILTQPFDVIKTKRQAVLGLQNNENNGLSKNIINHKNGMIAVSKKIIDKRGIYGLYAGITPRLMRVPLACAIMVTTYEFGKFQIGLRKNEGNDGNGGIPVYRQ